MQFMKFTAAFLAAAVLAAVFAASSPCRAAAQGAANAAQDSADAAQAGPADVKAVSAVLAEASTGEVLWQNNSRERVSPASITKIMTELLVLEALEAGKIKWNDNVTCSAHCASMGGSDIWLAPGEVMSVSDLFKAMAVNSANDAAVALAETVAGSEPAFAAMMNDRAAKLGMKDTHFVNCTGLDAEGNYTSAYDVMLMSRELISHREVFDYSTIWMDTLRGGKTGLYNTNKLIHSYPGANGLKTGSTDKAGYCLSATALRGGMQLIAVVMGCRAVADRFGSAASLLDYGFAGWSAVTPQLKRPGVTLAVRRGESRSVAARAADIPRLIMKKGSEKEITERVSIVSQLLAPVARGQTVGEVTFWCGGRNIGSAPYRAVSSVGRLGFGGAFMRLFALAAGGL
jgi:D-alanyl-D-alanine carboxypeptidase (penicillin-binding protein 5/6)